MILGSNRSEYASFAYTNQMKLSRADTASITSVTEMTSLIQSAITYGSDLHAGFYVEEAAQKILSDAGHKAVYGYRNLWGENPAVTNEAYSIYVGAGHGSDLDFLCEQYGGLESSVAPGAIHSANLDGRKKMSNRMQNYMKYFMRNGNPNGAGVRTWNTWTTGDNVQRLLMFDATQTDTALSMSAEYLKQNAVFETMQKNLTEAHYNLLVFSNMAGRFFMPEVVPEYPQTPEPTQEPGETSEPTQSPGATPESTQFPSTMPE